MEYKLEKYMEQCLVLAEAAFKAGNPPVGALIVMDDQIIGSGIESAKSTGDVTDHAEIMAIRDALRNGHRDKLHQAQLFTTHEPCAMCSYVIRHYRIPEIVYGIPVPFVGGASSSFRILTTNEVPQWGTVPDVKAGVCAEACQALNERFRALR